MPVFNILLAHDVSYYGSVEVEADTWSEAVASLTDADWGGACYFAGWDCEEIEVQP